MKKNIRYCAAAILCSFLPAMTAGCSDIPADTSSQAAIQMEISESDSSEITAETEFVAETVMQTTSVEAVTETITTASSVATAEAIAADPSDETVGSTGLTTDEWCAIAQSMYENAATVAFSYFGSTAGCVIDESDTVDTIWCRVTNYSTVEEATAAYFAVFSKTYHENDLSDKFQMIDDKLYCCLGERGSDISYVSSEVTALTASADTSLSFTVVSTYQFPDENESTVQEDAFSLVYENGQWLVGEFTLPY